MFSQKSGFIDNSLIFRNISKSSSEILVEVWDQGQKVGDADLFMGLGIGNKYILGWSQTEFFWTFQFYANDFCSRRSLKLKTGDTFIQGSNNPKVSVV